MNNLIEPTAKYIDRVENSWNYLNSPKHMLNHDLDCVYRQFIVDDKETAIKNVADYLRYYGMKNPIETATKFVNWRDGIKLAEFDSINVNPYIDKTPAHIDAKHKRICDWIDEHTTYYSPIYGGGVKEIPSYPMKYR